MVFGDQDLGVKRASWSWLKCRWSQALLWTGLKEQQIHTPEFISDSSRPIDILRNLRVHTHSFNYSPTPHDLFSGCLSPGLYLSSPNGKELSSLHLQPLWASLPHSGWLLSMWGSIYWLLTKERRMGEERREETRRKGGRVGWRIIIVYFFFLSVLSIFIYVV